MSVADAACAAGSPGESGEPVTVTAAAKEAEAAAQAARVRITEATDLADAQAAERVARQVWGPGIGVRADLVRALCRAGTATLIARDVRAVGAPVVGFTAGFVGWHGGMHLHSHQLAVVCAEQGRGVGYALKLAQRTECLRRGITVIRWTFDPLLARNARFNLIRLGARVVAFLPDFYGHMADRINADDSSDRFEVAWQIDVPARPRPPEHSRVVGPVLAIDEDGLPRRMGRIQPGGTVSIPPDYAVWRAAGDSRARQWRCAAGEVFAEAFAAGLTVADFRAGHYVLGGRDDRW
jgi:predicted GNAT superfamily acetyltransferase